MRGTESVIRCFAPCFNAVDVEEPWAARTASSIRDLMAELTAPRREAAQRRAELQFVLDLDESGRHTIEIK